MAGNAQHHHRQLGSADAGGARLLLAIAVNLALTAAQVVGGILSGSLALIADAVHNLSDAMSLIIAWVARRIGRRPPDADMTFGYKRAEVVAALVNYTTLILIGLYLVYEGVWRLISPEPVTGWIVVAVAFVALAVDLLTAALTWRMSKSSMNIRAAFLHNLSDVAGSLAVIVAGTVILLWDWRLIDPLVTLGLAAWILWQAVSELGPVIRVLMLGVPAGMEPARVAEALRELDGVDGVHQLHLWQVQEHENALDAHVVVAEGRWGQADAIKAAARSMLADRFGIGHVTLEMECARHACAGAATPGRGNPAT